MHIHTHVYIYIDICITFYIPMTFFLRIFIDARAPTLDHPRLDPHWFSQAMESSHLLSRPPSNSSSSNKQPPQILLVGRSMLFSSFLFGYQLQFCFNSVKRMLMDVGCLHASHCTASNQDSEYLHIFTCLTSRSSMASRKMGLSHAYIA